MMTSLTPGTIFQTTGFNRNSTPTPPNISPAMLNSRYNKGDFDGRPWPHDSPVSRMYDVQNTSTKMIILNNKYGRSGTRLRGYYTGPQKPDRSVDPERHRAPSPRNLDHHVSCYNSSSPKFEPAIRVNLDWYDSSQRSDNALAVKGSVNPTRHMSCQTPRETLRYQPEAKQRVPIPSAKYFSAKEFSDMSLGDKIYMWSIERIYNVENLKKLKQDQYKKLLQLEAKKGYHGFQEYQKYMRYINSASSRSYGTGTPRSPISPAGSRARSAFSARSGASSPTKSKTKQDGASNRADSEAGDQSRPKTAMGITRTESPTKKESPKEKEPERKEIQPKSPSPSRKSSAKSARSVASTRSIKSRSSSRPSSKASSKHSESLPRAEHSDTSLSTEAETDSKHKEGRDRPKSRLGHKSAEDRDKGGIHSSLSSLSSIRSDKHSSSDDSGLEKDKAKPKKKDSLSNSSRSSRASGSNVSLGSRKSDTNPRPVPGGSKKPEHDKQVTNKDKMLQGNDNIKDKDTKIHNVPSGSLDKGDTTEEKQETKPGPKEPEHKDQKNHEDNKEIKNKELKEESNEIKEPKIKFNEGEHGSNHHGNGGQDDGGNPLEVKTEGPSSTVDGNKETKPAEGADKPIERQDSLEEADVDRRVNKDLDKIEY